jgi:hypothetical protein
MAPSEVPSPDGPACKRLAPPRVQERSAVILPFDSHFTREATALGRANDDQGSVRKRLTAQRSAKANWASRCVTLRRSYSSEGAWAAGSAFRPLQSRLGRLYWKVSISPASAVFSIAAKSLAQCFVRRQVRLSGQATTNCHAGREAVISLWPARSGIVRAGRGSLLSLHGTSSTTGPAARRARSSNK